MVGIILYIDKLLKQKITYDILKIQFTLNSFQQILTIKYFIEMFKQVQTQFHKLHYVLVKFISSLKYLNTLLRLMGLEIWRL